MWSDTAPRRVVRQPVWPRRPPGLGALLDRQTWVLKSLLINYAMLFLANIAGQVHGGAHITLAHDAYAALVGQWLPGSPPAVGHQTAAGAQHAGAHHAAVALML